MQRRVDPQIVVGLLVDRHGFPLEIGCFEGNKAETLTLLPIIRQFQARHQITGMVVVADAGMLSATNLRELDDAGLGFIVGSRTTRHRSTWNRTTAGTGTTSPTGRSSTPSPPHGRQPGQRPRPQSRTGVASANTHLLMAGGVGVLGRPGQQDTQRPGDEGTGRGGRGGDDPNPEVRHRQRRRPHPRRSGPAAIAR